MIKARLMSRDSKAIFLFGLSEGDLADLRAERPIMADLEPLGGPQRVSIVICCGETKQAIVDVLRAQGWKGLP